MINFLTNNLTKIIIGIYVIIISFVLFLIFSSYGNAMFSVQNKTGEEDYKKYVPKSSFNEKYEYYFTYIKDFKF